MDIQSSELDWTSIGKRIRKHRNQTYVEDKAMSQDELADRAGVNRNYISQMERGLAGDGKSTPNPTINVLVGLCNALDIDLYYLLGMSYDDSGETKKPAGSWLDLSGLDLADRVYMQMSRDTLRHLRSELGAQDEDALLEDVS